jgi:hypothetical protein
MRKVVITALTAAVTCACSESTRTPATPTELTAPLQVQAAQPDGIAKNHTTHLSGDQEVFTPSTPGGPTPADSRAQGEAHFMVSNDGTSVDYKLMASNINNAFMAHIHCGVPGSNGPIVVWLFPSTDPVPGPQGGGRHDGVLAEGTFTNANVIARPDNAACPGGVSSLADVLAKIKAHGTYVNVHTSDGNTTPNEGPGDFPGGEIRGQLDK